MCEELLKLRIQRFAIYDAVKIRILPNQAMHLHMHAHINIYAADIYTCFCHDNDSSLHRHQLAPPPPPMAFISFHLFILQFSFFGLIGCLHVYLLSCVLPSINNLIYFLIIPQSHKLYMTIALRIQMPSIIPTTVQENSIIIYILVVRIYYIYS